MHARSFAVRLLDLIHFDFVFLFHLPVAFVCFVCRCPISITNIISTHNMQMFGLHLWVAGRHKPCVINEMQNTTQACIKWEVANVRWKEMPFKRNYGIVSACVRVCVRFEGIIGACDDESTQDAQYLPRTFYLSAPPPKTVAGLWEHFFRFCARQPINIEMILLFCIFPIWCEYMGERWMPARLNGILCICLLCDDIFFHFHSVWIIGADDAEGIYFMQIGHRWELRFVFLFEFNIVVRQRISWMSSILISGCRLWRRRFILGQRIDFK